MSGGEAMLPHQLALCLPPPPPDPRSRQQELMSPPPPVRRRLNPSCSLPVHWSRRMQVQESQLECPFRLNRAQAQQLIMPTTAKSSPMAHKAVSAGRVAAGRPELPTAVASSSHGFELALCGPSPEEPVVTLYKLLDRLGTHCLDFATMLKFFEFFGWDSDDGRNKHDAWIHDWHDILKFLGNMDDTTQTLQMRQFTCLVHHPDRPPLLREYTVARMLYHVQHSYLAGRFVGPPPRWNDFPLESAVEFSMWYVDNHQTHPLIWYLKDHVRRVPVASTMLLPDGIFFLYWYYTIFGHIVNDYFTNWLELREINRHPADVPETSSPVCHVERSIMPSAVYEKIRVCWLYDNESTYLFLNLMDKKQNFFSDLKWELQKPERMGVSAADAEVLDGSDRESFPDCICTGQWRGLKSMVYASNKKNRSRGILLAIYLHDLLTQSRGSSVEKTTDLDRLVLSWLDLMNLSPTTVDFIGNTMIGPGTQLQDMP